MKILVVDDEQDVKSLFEQRFRKEIKSGYMDFAFAYSGREALSYLKNNFRKSIIILSDINMPEMSGLELLQRIRAKYKNPSPYVMMVTAYGDEENLNTAKKMGANGFFTKPVDFKILKSKLKPLYDV